MLTHRGTMASVVAAAAVLVRSFETLSLWSFCQHLSLQNYSKFFFFLWIHEFKEFFIRKSIHKDIVLLFIIHVYNFCFNYEKDYVRKNIHSHQIIKRSYFYALYTLFLLNINIGVCIVFQKPGGIDISPEDTLISYLPLAHSYERLLEVHSIHVLPDCYC